MHAYDYGSAHNSSLCPDWKWNRTAFLFIGPSSTTEPNRFRNTYTFQYIKVEWYICVAVFLYLFNYFLFNYFTYLFNYFLFNYFTNLITLLFLEKKKGGREGKNERNIHDERINDGLLPAH